MHSSSLVPPPVHIITSSTSCLVSPYISTITLYQYQYHHHIVTSIITSIITLYQYHHLISVPVSSPVSSPVPSPYISTITLYQYQYHHQYHHLISVPVSSPISSPVLLPYISTITLYQYHHVSGNRFYTHAHCRRSEQFITNVWPVSKIMYEDRCRRKLTCSNIWICLIKVPQL